MQLSPQQEVLDEKNYRALAEKAIKTYEKKNMILDAMFWARIISHYNNDILFLEAELRLTHDTGRGT